ncbi:MAG: phytanoyl-CoA dioxygenase family protein [Armatimonadetes bacterium]|nr:phytanoyl-CoA dioxygenase family protein [Armatimonadota bacterium]
MSTQFSPLRKSYEDEGYAIVRGVLDQDLIREASDHVDWLMQKHPELRPEHLGHNLLADDPFWVRLVGDHRLLDVAEQFLGPNIALFASHYISKPPGDGMPVLWHQDGSYWPLDPMEVVTLWLAVDDSTAQNGCMRVIPGTQRLDLQQLRERRDVANVLSSSMEDSHIDESKAVDVVLKAGDVSVHHPNLIHGSNANTSTRRRCGLTIRYIPTSTRITSNPWPSAFLLRGEAVPGVNDYLPRPKYDPAKHIPFRDMPLGS